MMSRFIIPKNTTKLVIPAEAGIHNGEGMREEMKKNLVVRNGLKCFTQSLKLNFQLWIPAYAGMTKYSRDP